METALTSLFDLQHPIVLAPMGSIAGGRLAAAVSNAGGLGLVGGGYGDAQWLATELSLARQGTMCAWGVGFITWSVHRSVVELALGYGPDAVMLSFGDPAPYARMIKASGAALICQVQDLEEAQRAVDAGADVIVAQGTEGGGHGGRRSTFSLVPAVVDAVAPIPVVAAGGIADGRGLAAALALGAEGVLLGTRFLATHEAPVPNAGKRAIVAATESDTICSIIPDQVSNPRWTDVGALARSLRTPAVLSWVGREAELRAMPDDARKALAAQWAKARTEGRLDETSLLIGEDSGLIHEILPAGDVVRRVVSDAEQVLGGLGRFTASRAGGA